MSAEAPGAPDAPDAPEPSPSPSPSASASPSDAHPRFAEALLELGLGDLLPRVRRFPEQTRTAAEAAAAIGCELSEICKSLIFAAWGSPLLEQGRELGGGVPVLVLMDGSSRVDLDLVRQELGAEKVTRARADLVRETTGYAIGGVPPFGHATRTRVLADRSLLDHEVVWAAAGTPYAVFPMAPKTLIAHAGGTLVDVRETAK
ncbi:YbaK/EbsC family protein [Streptomyces sp. NPDC004732]|uniref:YbaK/EbsC family protein n=1 Tax=Streptomyces sp. NPDC004732 TaxID=3154290 RepID=UPI0033AA96F9